MWLFMRAYFIFFLISVAIVIWMYYASKFFKRNPSSLRLAITNFVVTYLLIIISVLVYDVYLTYKVSTFDLDGDGFFTTEEWTPEYAKYSGKLVNDLGRNLAPITGFITSFLYSILFFIVLTLGKIIKRKKTKS